MAATGLVSSISMRFAPGLVGAAVTLSVLLLQAYPKVKNPMFWAEDLRILWLQQFTAGILDVVLTPFAGYLILAPRLIAWAAWLFPLEYHPLFYVLASVAVVAWAGGIIAASADRPAMGVLMALFLVGIPHMGSAWMTPTNLQWVMA